MARENLLLLGETIALFRRRVGKRQIELAAEMGWGGTGPLVELEKGRRLPRSETLDRLGEKLNLEFADLCYLHGLAGYGGITTLPPLKQIVAALDAVDADLRNCPYPAYIVDYRFRCWMMNSACLPFVGGDKKILEDIAARGTTIFEGVFSSELPTRQYILNIDQLEAEYVFNFKARNLFRRHEPFYIDYPGIMKDRLPYIDYERFARMWNNVDALTQWKLFSQRVPVSLNVEGATVNFVARVEGIPTLQDMFFIHSFEPISEPGNQELHKILFQSENTKLQENVRAWDLAGAKAWDNHPLTAPAPSIDRLA